MSHDNGKALVGPTSQIATGVAPPHSLEAEQSVLGGILLSDRALVPIVHEERLRPVHFYRERHRLIFQGMCELLDKTTDPDESICDVLILTEHLREKGQLDAVGGKAAIDELTGGVPGLGGIRRYAQIVKLHWEKRQILSGTYEIQAGILNHDDEQVERGRRTLNELVSVSVEGVGRPRTVERDAARDYLEQWLLAKHPDGFPSPWPGLYRAVKQRPGHITVVGGWTNAGKSMIAFQMLAHVAQKVPDARCVAWITEMTPEEHWVRQLVRDGAGDFDTLMRGDVEAAIDRGEIDAAKWLRAMANLPFGVQPVQGWPIEDICRDIIQTRPTFAVLDHFHALTGVSKTSDADDAIAMLSAATERTGTHLVVVAQLNNARWDGAKPPPPTLRDLRNTGALAQLPSNVILLHRDSEKIDDPDSDTDKYTYTDQGVLIVAKARTGRVGDLIPIQFIPDRLMFRERERGAW